MLFSEDRDCKPFSACYWSKYEILYKTETSFILIRRLRDGGNGIAMVLVVAAVLFLFMEWRNIWQYLRNTLCYTLEFDVGKFNNFGERKKKQYCLLQGQAQLYHRVVFRCVSISISGRVWVSLSFVNSKSIKPIHYSKINWNLWNLG